MPKDKKPRYVKSEDSKAYKKYKSQKMLAEDSKDNLKYYQDSMREAGNNRWQREEAAESFKNYVDDKADADPDLKEARDKYGKRGRKRTSTGLKLTDYAGEGNDIASITQYKDPKREVVVGKKPKKKADVGNSVTYNSKKFQKRNRRYE